MGMNMKTDLKYFLAYNLQFFADGPGGEKTEEPTTKKLGDARKEGQVARSQEIIIGGSLVTTFLSLKLFIGYVGDKFLNGFSKYYGSINTTVGDAFNANKAQTIINEVIKDVIIIGLPIMLIALVASFVVVVFQVKWEISLKPLMPKFGKINPLQGFKKMFSKDKIFELIKSVAKIGLIFWIVYNEYKDNLNFLANLYDVTLEQAIALIGTMVIDLGLKISIIYLLLGFADLFYQKRKFKKDMMMTKQELKDEFKQQEGDPTIKGRIRQKMREMSQRRMMQQLPEADVVITNPTHFAVALKYDRESSKAPVVIAKGADHIAAKIKEVAKENNIEIVENKPLARMLYFNVELGDEIPQELYQTVAEILAYVYKLKHS